MKGHVEIVLNAPLELDYGGTCDRCGALVVWFKRPGRPARIPFDREPRPPVLEPFGPTDRWRCVGVVHWFTCDGGAAALEAL